MAYSVIKAYSNGYRCSCCHRSSAGNAVWFDDLDTALDEIPDEPEIGGDFELESVVVVDGATGERIAWGQLAWPPGRSYAYGHSQWIGFKREAFEKIYAGDKLVTDKTWNEIVQAAIDAKRKIDIERAEREKKALEERIAKLKASTT